MGEKGVKMFNRYQGITTYGDTVGGFYQGQAFTGGQTQLRGAASSGPLFQPRQLTSPLSLQSPTIQAPQTLGTQLGQALSPIQQLNTGTLNYISQKNLTTAAFPSTQTLPTLPLVTTQTLFAEQPFVLKPPVASNGFYNVVNNAAMQDFTRLQQQQQAAIQFSSPKKNSNILNGVTTVGPVSAFPTPFAYYSDQISKLVPNSNNFGGNQQMPTPQTFIPTSPLANDAKTARIEEKDNLYSDSRNHSEQIIKMPEGNPFYKPNERLNTVKEELERTNVNDQTLTVDMNITQVSIPIAPVQLEIKQEVPALPKEEVKLTEHYTDGSTYIGTKKNDMRHGKGKLFYINGGVYDGDWNEGRMEGKGVLYFASGNVAYQGDFKDDKFEGHGVLHNEGAKKFTGTFNYQNFDELDGRWTRYEGTFVDDMKHGKGTLYLSNGETYSGTFKEDVVDGPGEYKCLSGLVIHGIWSQNLLQETSNKNKRS
eukprot:TRINITY_DN3916_c0_g1_i7.p1 TRINITY_DN3916_c0_g1~~TRINITY_DN3916_c0_g1_i7.p1  ORF type:complete len:480 (+),score=89.22 TRINITY_DN3916_c0_g1_i7:102-1541(+)